VVVLAPPSVLVVVDDGDELPVDPVPVEVVVLPPTEVVVVDEDEVVLVVVVVDVLVVVVGAGRVGVGLLKTPPTVVPLEWPPKRSANGRPAMSSIPVTSRSEKTNTASTTPATMGQRSPDPGAAGLRSTSGVGPVSGSVGGGVVSATAPSAWVALVAVSSVSAEEPDGSASVTPAAVVPPNRRSNFEVSGTRTTTCLTAWFVRSIDWNSNAVPVVAATEPMATPTMVPLTPKMEAITADNTAPPAEARICR
jgi:hypothetical protein